MERRGTDVHQPPGAYARQGRRYSTPVPADGCSRRYCLRLLALYVTCEWSGGRVPRVNALSDCWKNGRRDHLTSVLRSRYRDVVFRRNPPPWMCAWQHTGFHRTTIGPRQALYARHGAGETHAVATSGSQSEAVCGQIVRYVGKDK